MGTPSAIKLDGWLLEQDRIDRLSSIGFKWALKGKDTPWDTRFDELVQYKAKHGDCNVPKESGKLGLWIYNQRKVYKDGKLEQGRIDRLNSTGFKWALKEAAPIVPWETRFKELVRYKTDHGDCNVPKSQGKLGTWVQTQRQQYKKNRLAQDRIDRLDSIGFDWTPRKGPSRERRTIPSKKNHPSSRKKRSSLISTNAVSISAVTGVEAGEGLDVTSPSVPAPSNGSHPNLGTDIDDEDVDEIGALIYDQVMQRRRDTNEVAQNCVHQTLQDTTARQKARST